MKTYSLIIVFLLFTFVTMSQTKSPKRGIGYGYHTAADMQEFSSFLSWWYNWAAVPETAVSSIYSGLGVDFVPMARNAQGITPVNNWLSTHDNAQYILGFNEPNFKSQANMTPSQAAAAWINLQTVAQNNEVKLVGPAVNYCGDCVQENGVTYTNPFTYLDDFFEACTDCQVDYIALHWYGGGASMPGYINDARKYGKKIWVTEFAAWDNSVTNAAGQRQYLAGTVNFLERDPDIFRYAWFIGRTSGGIGTYPYIDIYGSEATLTPLGQVYRDVPVYDSMQVFTLPGRIEVEEYYLMNGLFTEITSDTDGYLNVGWTDAGDWADYKIDVQTDGIYTIKARTSGTSTGTIRFLVDNNQLIDLSVPSTGGWQTWKTISTTVTLTKGQHLLRMKVQKAGFNINWIEFTEGTVSIQQFKPLEVIVFPNPISDGWVNVQVKTQTFGESYTIKLFDLIGNQVLYQQLKANSYSLFFNVHQSFKLSPGIYTLQIENKSGKTVKQILVD